MLYTAISYFYHVRHFDPYMIPVSTAVWDPKWYHNFRCQDYCFIDKRGVINGLRNNALVPNQSIRNLCRGHDSCYIKDPTICNFLSGYRKQLFSIDIEAFKENLVKSTPRLVSMLGLDRDPLYVFMVHESTDNPCSERVVLQEWLKANNLGHDELSQVMHL